MGHRTVRKRSRLSFSAATSRLVASSVSSGVAPSITTSVSLSSWGKAVSKAISLCRHSSRGEINCAVSAVIAKLLAVKTSAASVRPAVSNSTIRGCRALAAIVRLMNKVLVDTMPLVETMALKDRGAENQKKATLAGQSFLLSNSRDHCRLITGRRRSRNRQLVERSGRCLRRSRIVGSVQRLPRYSNRDFESLRRARRYELSFQAYP